MHYVVQMKGMEYYMVNIIVAGAAGRVGARIINVIGQTDGVKLAGAFEHPESPSVGQDAGIAAGLGAIGIKIAGSINKVIRSGRCCNRFYITRRPPLKISRLFQQKAFQW